MIPELGDFVEGKVPSNLSTRKVTGRLMSHDKKNRNSFPLIASFWLSQAVNYHNLGFRMDLLNVKSVDIRVTVSGEWAWKTHKLRR